MKLIRYDHTRNLCLVCIREGNVYRLVDLPPDEVPIEQLIKDVIAPTLEARA